MRSYLQRGMGNRPAAVKSVEAALERRCKATGELHPALIWPRYVWAEALIGTGDFAGAVKVYHDTVTLCEQIYPAHHRAIGITKSRPGQAAYVHERLGARGVRAPRCTADLPPGRHELGESRGLPCGTARCDGAQRPPARGGRTMSGRATRRADKQERGRIAGVSDRDPTANSTAGIRLRSLVCRAGGARRGARHSRNLARRA